MSALAATTYLQLYRAAPDVLAGEYGPWLDGHSSTAPSPAAVRELMLNTADTVPKVYLTLTVGPQGTPVVKTLHRPKLYGPLPGVVTPWDNQVYAFGTDLGPGNQITTVKWPDQAFHQSIANLWAPDAASMAAAWDVDPLAASLGPFVANEAGTVLTRTRMLMVVPQAYTHLVVNATLTPREAWVRLSTQIFTDNRAISCAPLLDWLRVASTLEPAAAGAAAGHIETSPVLREALVAPVPDDSLARHRWNIVLTDFPAFAGVSNTQEDAMLRALAAMQQVNVQQAAATQLERTEARAPKPPSHKFPATYLTLQKVSGADTEQALPTIWHDFANCSKSELRLVLAAAFQARAQEFTAATPTTPAVTKEILECYTQQNLFSENQDNLEEGLQLFKFTPSSESHTRDTRIRTNLYDLISAGDAAPSVSDIRALASTKVLIPTSQYELTTALKHHSLALDVYLSPQHPLCVFYRSWIRQSWEVLEPSIRQFIQQYFSAQPATAYAHFARWISLKMNGYLELLFKHGITTPLPKLEKFDQMIGGRENFFPSIPEQYLEPPARPSPAQPAARPSPAPPGRSQPPARPVPIPPGTSTSSRERVENLRPTETVVLAYEALHLRVKECYNIQAPPNGQFGPICMTFHGAKTCFANCGKARSHKPLSAVDQEKLLSYCGTIAAARGPAVPPS
jgi:hypothetical protein